MVTVSEKGTLRSSSELMSEKVEEDKKVVRCENIPTKNEFKLYLELLY